MTTSKARNTRKKAPAKATKSASKAPAAAPPAAASAKPAKGAKAPSKPAAPPPNLGEVLGEIPTELRVRMKGLTEAINEKRAAMGNLSFQATEFRLKLSEIEKAEAEHFRTAAAMNREMEECRQQIGQHVEMQDGTEYHVDLTSGSVHAIKR
jgi:hypothetical protein